MKKSKVNKTFTKVDRLKRLLNITLLVCIILSLGILLEEFIFAKLSEKSVFSLDVIFAVIWIFFTVENIFRVIALKTKSEKQYYLKFEKAEIIYFIVSLIVIPLSFTFVPLRVLRWIALFKLPNVLRRFNDEKTFQIIAKLIAILLILFFLIPFLNVIAVSFSSPGQIINILPKKLNLFSIKYVLSDVAFLKSFGNSIFITVVGTLISVVSMSMAAYPLSKPDMPLRKTMMMFFMIVMLFSGGIAPNILLVNALGLTDTIWALIFPSVVIVYYLLLLKGFYESIPAELEESAKLDGASNFQILWKIIMPIASPMIATVSFFTIITYWNNINNSILYITSNQKLYPVPMYIKNFLSRDPMDVAQSMPGLLPYWDNIKMSYILFSIVPIVCAYPFIFKYLKNDVSAGAVKG
ncbi:MAG: binding-protein-dependent transport system inner rane component [Anaerocolumna sp.]|jgi:putative aldouronate transport system permease protein|nr:binding-protein-dependent transport system inner rane component [Anaerocolumna sp.]